jgi:hypothetical protein
MENVNIQIFIVFHKNIFDECYKNIPQDVLYKYFTFYAVNKNIKKNYTQNKYKIINEWELSIYDETFQNRGYNENSSIYHVYINKLHKNYKYIGFFQYDMMFNNNIIDFLQTSITQTPILFSLGLYHFNDCGLDEEHSTLKFIINDYNNFYKKVFNTNNKFPLYNSYVIPNETYEKIMKWVIQLYDKMYPWCITHPNKSHFGRIGGIYERVMAYCIGDQHLQHILLDVLHDNKYKSLSY